MKKFLSTLKRVMCSALLVSLFPLTATAQTAKGEHTVQSGETLYHISKVYGTTIEDILTLNPGLTAATLKTGAVIKIPAVTKKSAATTTTTKPAAQTQTEVRAALLLPLSATGIEGGRSLEFYRGFMMAADKIEHDGGTVTLYGYDEKSTDASLAATLEKIKQNGVQMIIGPVYPMHFAEVANFARQNAIRMVVPFYSKVEQVNTNPYVYLINTPDKFEQELKADLFVKTFPTSSVGNVAIMHMTAGSETAFTQSLKKRLNALGYAVTEFSIDAPLEQMRSACSPKHTTVIIPDDGHEEALNKVLVKMEGFKKYYPSYKTQVIGYGKWLNEDTKYAERMHNADMYLFSTSYYNRYDRATKQFDADYEAQFQATQSDTNPRMALLGYDTGLHLLSGIIKNGKAFSTQATAAQQLQSRIRFVRTEQDGGLFSSSLFFIHYKTDGSTDRITEK